MGEPVTALAPFVARALDARGRVEALGPAGSERTDPRSDAAPTAWGAAHHAGQRVE